MFHNFLVVWKILEWLTQNTMIHSVQWGLNFSAERHLHRWDSRKGKETPLPSLPPHHPLSLFHPTEFHPSFLGFARLRIFVSFNLVIAGAVVSSPQRPSPQQTQLLSTSGFGHRQLTTLKSPNIFESDSSSTEITLNYDSGTDYKVCLIIAFLQLISSFD